MRYAEIARTLRISPEEDRKAALVLDGLVKEPDLEELGALIRGRTVIVLGCGPSLAGDITKIKATGKKFTFIAADGAVGALLEHGIIPDINVTDLDGDAGSIIRASALGTVTVVHAHGDNVKKLREIVSKLTGTVVGTTQTAPAKNVSNFGGFTDGDRAVHVAVRFGAKKIALAGMDFGMEIGNHSGEYKLERKLKKLAIGKRLIEGLAATTGIRIVNLTHGGEDLMGVPRASVESL